LQITAAGLDDDERVRFRSGPYQRRTLVLERPHGQGAVANRKFPEQQEMAVFLAMNAAASDAGTAAGKGLASPASRRTTPRMRAAYATYAAAGFPGSTATKTAPSCAKPVGLAGRNAIESNTNVAPSASSAPLTRSRAPAEAPPVVITRSQQADARCRVARSGASESHACSRNTICAPSRSTQAASIAALLFRTCPVRGRSSIATSSLPVETIARRGRRYTASVA
jgi:hypothetical protein